MPQSIADELKSIAKSSSLGESLERAHKFAREQSHRLVTLEHLLLALTEDPEAALILQAANVDLARLRTDVSSHLGRLADDMRGDGGSEPRPDPELLRVLQAAASAAQQSKRKQIDGAIVLAAVVGDGKSPAAGTLKAHGMTFEEAIRALQRANTQARLKTPAKAKDAGAKSQERAVALPPEAKPANEPSVSDVRASADEPASLASRLAPHAGSADDILAAARARIQQRSGPATGQTQTAKSDPVDATLEAQAEGPYGGDSHVHTAGAEASQHSSDAFEELLAVSTAGKPPPPPDTYRGEPASGQAMGAGARQGWAPPPDSRVPPDARNGPPPHGARSLRQSLAAQQRTPRPGPGPAMGPAMGPGSGPGAAGFPNRPNRAAPWPEPGDINGHARPSPTSGGIGQRAPAAQRAGAQSDRGADRQSDRGPLIESVPRRMRFGKASKAEVRIARDRIEGLVSALNGHGQTHRPDQFIARALSVRLKAPNGGFAIEQISPETQWVETGPSLGPGLMHDDYAIWRWTVTPHKRGRGRLQLIVSARTVGHDGLAAELAPPDRLIEVRVAPDRMRRLGRLLGWLMVIGVGAALGRYRDPLWSAAQTALKNFLEKFLAG